GWCVVEGIGQFGFVDGTGSSAAGTDGGVYLLRIEADHLHCVDNEVMPGSDSFSGAIGRNRHRQNGRRRRRCRWRDAGGGKGCDDADADKERASLHKGFPETFRLNYGWFFNW